MNDDAFEAVMGSTRGAGPRQLAQRIQEMTVPAGWDPIRVDIDYEGECLVGYVPKAELTGTSSQDFDDSMWVVYEASLDTDEGSATKPLRRPVGGPEPEFLRFDVHPGGLFLLAYNPTAEGRAFSGHATVSVRLIHHAEDDA